MANPASDVTHKGADGKGFLWEMFSDLSLGIFRKLREERAGDHSRNQHKREESDRRYASHSNKRKRDLTKNDIPGVRLMEQQSKPFAGSVHQHSPTNAIENYGEQKWLYRSLTEVPVLENESAAAKEQQKPGKKVAKRTNEGHRKNLEIHHLSRVSIGSVDRHDNALKISRLAIAD